MYSQPVADGPGGFFRAVPIALHNLRPLDDQLPDLIVSQNPFTVFRVDNTGEGSGNRHTYGTRLLLPKHGVGMGNGEASVSPKPSVMGVPVTSSNFFSHSTGMGADPEIQNMIWCRSYWARFFCCNREI